MTMTGAGGGFEAAAGGGAIVDTKCSASPGVLSPGYSQPTNTIYASVNGGTLIPANTKFYLLFSVSNGDNGSAEPSWKLGSTSGLALTKAIGALATTNVEVWYGDTGGSSYTDSIVFTGSANQYNKIQILCGYLTNAAAGAPSNTSTMVAGNYGASGSPVQTVVTVPTSPSAGIAIVGLALANGNTGTPYTVTWTGATEVENKALAANSMQIWHADATVSATVNATNSALAFDSGIVSASWAHQ
jgi:hypothetical protein